jgi:hypothetical protein
MRGLVLVSLIVVWAPAAAADDLPKWVLDLSRIQRAMGAEFARLPNYTCAETIDRYTAQGKQGFRLSDRIRINVAMVGGHELYAWPGNAFENLRLNEMVPSGFISDGMFSVVARNVFTGAAAQISFTGEETQGGRPTLSYRFRIPQIMSPLQIKVGSASGTAGIQGSFQADAASLEVLKLEFAGEDMPPSLPWKSLDNAIEYSKVTLSGRPVLLPRIAEMRVESFNGERHYNHVAFNDCHEYGSQTTITFEEEPSARDALPANLELKLRLDTPIDLAVASRGDTLKGTLVEDAPPLHAGAVFTGVIRAVERHTGDDPRAAIAFEWTQAEDGGKPYSLKGSLSDVESFPGQRSGLLDSIYRDSGFRSDDPHAPPRTGSISANGAKAYIPAGVVMTWHTTR